MPCGPITIDTGCRPITVSINGDTTTITVDHARKPHSLPLLIWLLGPIQEQNLGPFHSGVPHMTTLTDTQMVSGTIQPLDKKGKPAPVQAGSSVFSSSDSSVITVDSVDLSVTVKAVAAGTAQVRWSADADLGDGVVTISAAEDFVVTGGQAVSAGFTFGTPTEQA